MFNRIAVVNRGEAAMRFIHAAREVRAETGQLCTIALYTSAEARAMFVREADEAVEIASVAGSPYLDYDELSRALRVSRAEAAWVGWGFVAEHADFAARCADLGVVFIGPPPEVMRRLGDKIEAKLLAEAAGVPVAPWSGGPVASVDEARSNAATIGYPLMVKAASGGGGRGIRRVAAEGELAMAWERARSEAAASFGDDTVFLERVVSGARHVEVQIVADDHGNVWTPGLRDCSVQRRNQKILEESASTALPDPLVEEAKAAAVRLARLAGYRNAGTVEFLYQPDENQLAFLEVNTRLQVEHPVTEVTTGIDLVKLQLHVASGGRLEGEPPPPRGHAIEVRLNAEDPDAGFAPAPGVIEHLAWPNGPGIRVDTGYATGDVIPAQYDSMVAKLVAWGTDREEARIRLRRALAGTTALIQGGTTNKAFLAALLDHPEVIAGRFDTGWLDRLTASPGSLADGRSDVALIASAVAAADANATVERERFFAATAHGRAQGPSDAGFVAELQYRGQSYQLRVYRTGLQRYRVLAEGEAVEADVETLGRFERRLTFGTEHFRVVSLLHDTDRDPGGHRGSEDLVEVDGVPHRVSHESAGVVRAPAPGVVVDVRVQPGDLIGPDDPVAVIESMKMEVVIRAGVSGRVTEVLATPNGQVDAGAPLARIEVAGTGVGTSAGPPVAFDELAHAATGPTEPGERCLSILTSVKSLVLGFDFAPADTDRLITAYVEDRGRVGTARAAVIAAELEILTIFGDLSMLSRNRRTDDAGENEAAHNPRGYFLAYLQTLDTERSGLPSSFVDRLHRALAHYGIAELDPTPSLQEVLHRMFLAQQRVTIQLPAVLAILEHHLRATDVPTSARDQLLETLEKLIVATQRRLPVIGDLARSVRFTVFDNPMILAERERVMSEMRSHLARAVVTPDTEERDRLMARLVDCAQPLIELMPALGDREAERQRLVEVMIRRYYQIRPIAAVRHLEVGGRPGVAATYLEGDLPIEVAATDLRAADLINPPAGVARWLTGVEHASVLELYVRWEKDWPDADELAAQIEAALGAGPLPESLKRVTVTATATTETRGGPGVHRFTWVPARSEQATAPRLIEDRALRDLHPMIADRLHLWRLKNFNVTRLRSTPHVYLYRCVARDVPTDLRLIALAEVRDLTPLRDHAGTVAALPELERVLASCLDAIRRARAEAPERARPQWNRVVLSGWPVIDVPLEELLLVVRSLAPMTEGLDLEQVVFRGRLAGGDGSIRPFEVRVTRPPGTGLTIRVIDPPVVPLLPIDPYAQKVIQARRRGAVYPYELIPMLLRSSADAAPDRGVFTEYDLDAEARLMPVKRPYGENSSSMVVGTVSTPTARYPEGMTRVVLFGDPTKGLGSLAEPECRRVCEALDLATRLGVPVEWFAVSSGARIAMDSGTENMDWISRALRSIVLFTQAGGEINVIVAGINVGAQPYWNAEATMLMHTKGILVMTPDSAMVLTGKQALEYSGGVAAEDNFGIGGYDTVMGPNGQAQYWAPDLAAAVDILFGHYAFSYVAPGERFPRPAVTADPIERDVRAFPHKAGEGDFVTVGDIFSDAANPDRKKPFDIRTVIRAVVDQDRAPLERWPEMGEAETAVVFDAFLGGYPVSVIGAESKALPRRGVLPADGPSQWTAGTLFPRSSKKLARAINAASGNRPVVVLANLSGFDGSPESLRNLQLEYGAEIARAVVNFDGPIVFCVVSRYHGGAFVVFSASLNNEVEVAAVEGSFASVIGGPPAAAVVFTGEVNARTEADPRLADLRGAVADATGGHAAELRAQLEQLQPAVRAEKLGELADEFERVHTIERARAVGSIHNIVAPADLRPYLIAAVKRGIDRCSGRG